jgi:hypothetical protein
MPGPLDLAELRDERTNLSIGQRRMVLADAYGRSLGRLALGGAADVYQITTIQPRVPQPARLARASAKLKVVTGPMPINRNLVPTRYLKIHDC